MFAAPAGTPPLSLREREKESPHADSITAPNGSLSPLGRGLG